MSSGQYSLVSQKDMDPTLVKPALDMALVSIILTVAQVGTESGAPAELLAWRYRALVT